MKIEWTERRCLLCLSGDEPLSSAHFIPEALGGKLHSSMLCRGCNSDLGSRVEKGLKSDPAIRLAIDATETEAPSVRAIGDGQLYRAEDEGVQIQASRAAEEFSVLATRQPDGSLVKSDEEAIKDVETTLRRRRAPEAEIATARTAINRAPRGETVRLPRGLAIRKGSVSGFTPDLRAPLVPDVCFLAMAYLFAALHLGKSAYHPALKPIRDGLLGADGPHPWSVEALMARDEYRPVHRLVLDPRSPRLTVEVHLFSILVWRVVLGDIGFAEGAQAFVYEVDLASQAERMIPLAADDPTCIGGTDG